MALQPGKFTGQDRLQPGARGESFQVDMPGYRDQGDRVNRTNNKLNTNAHDVPNIKYEFDRRLPVLFRYGFAYGYNQIVVPKGRIVAADPNMDLLDFDMRSKNNTMTLANGGAPVRLRKAGDLYDASGTSTILSGTKIGQAVHNLAKDWVPLRGMALAYTDVSYRPFIGAGATPAVSIGPNAQLATAGFKISADTGKVVNTDGSATVDIIRAANVPLGILSRNEYTRDDDAYNGMMPGAVMTDAMVEMPWFAYKDTAEENPWGSAYGGLFPGALMKSDENGRFVVSPLSFPETEVATMGMVEYELERQQVVGQVYSVNNSLVPEGAAKWATWALSDRMNFVDFNPALDRQNGRSGEDAVSNSPYTSTGEYPGYPYDKTIGEHDLHMLASTARNSSNRMNPEYQYDNLGIPGLTDGQNAFTKAYAPEKIGSIFAAGGQEYVDMFFRTSEVNIEAGTLQISLGTTAFTNCAVGADLVATNGATTDQFIKVVYADEKQGIVKLEVTDKTKADAFLAGLTAGLEVRVKFSKRGLSGVPTFLDWNGCVGSVKILLTK
jgi:hypothetical protein